MGGRYLTSTDSVMTKDPSLSLSGLIMADSVEDLLLIGRILVTGNQILRVIYSHWTSSRLITSLIKENKDMSISTVVMVLCLDTMLH